MMGDLPVLSSMLSQLFESSKVLDDVSLHHLVDALCRLSTEDMETATNNKVKVKFFYWKNGSANDVFYIQIHVSYSQAMCHVSILKNSLLIIIIIIILLLS